MNGMANVGILLIVILAVVGLLLWVFLVRWVFRIDDIIQRLDDIAARLKQPVSKEDAPK